MQRRRLAQHIAGVTIPDGMFGYVPIPDPEGGPAGGDGGGGDGGDDKGGAGGTDDKGDKGEPKTFTQEQLNSMVAAERRKTESRFADYDDLKTKAAAFDKAAEDAKTEGQKAIDAAREEGKTEAAAAANARLIRAEARAMAAEAGFAKPELAVRALDLSGIKINDKGDPDEAAIKAALKDLAESGAFVINDGTGKSKPKPDPAQGGGTKGKPGKGLAGLSGDELYDRLHPKKTTTTA